MKDVITTHQLAQMLLRSKDQPVYTCDYAGDGGELMVYPVHGIDPNIIKGGTIICTGGDGLPYHAFPPMTPEDFIIDPECDKIMDKFLKDSNVVQFPGKPKISSGILESLHLPIDDPMFGVLAERFDGVDHRKLAEIAPHAA